MEKTDDAIGNGNISENQKYLCNYAAKCIAMSRQLNATSYPYDRSMVILKSLLEFDQS